MFPASFSPKTLRTAPDSALVIVKSRSLKTKAGQFLCKIASKNPTGTPIVLPENFDPIRQTDLGENSLLLWDDGSGLLLHPQEKSRVLPFVVEISSNFLSSHLSHIQRENIFQHLKTDAHLRLKLSQSAFQISQKYANTKDGWSTEDVLPFFRNRTPNVDVLGQNVKTRKLVQSLYLLTQAHPKITSLSLRCGVLSGPSSTWLLPPKISIANDARLERDALQNIKRQTEKFLLHLSDPQDLVGQQWNGELGGMLAHKKSQESRINEQWVHFTRMWLLREKTPHFTTTHERFSLLKEIKILAPDLINFI